MLWEELCSHGLLSPLYLNGLLGGAAWLVGCALLVSFYHHPKCLERGANFHTRDFRWRRFPAFPAYCAFKQIRREGHIEGTGQ